MAPRGFTLPPAATESAKQARSAFFCSLCQKGYSRMNEYEAHQSSYDHQHKKRLKDMKELQRQVVPPPKKGVDEKGKGALMQIKLTGKSGAAGGDGESAAGGAKGFKKGGFKNAFAPVEDEKEEKDKVKKEQGEDNQDQENSSATLRNITAAAEDEDSDMTDQEDYYDPRKPTGCLPGCPGRATVEPT